MQWFCEALGVSRNGFHAWLTRSPSARARNDEALGAKVKASFVGRDRTYGARRVWHDVLTIQRFGNATNLPAAASERLTISTRT